MKLDIPSTTQIGITHRLTINEKQRTVHCTCTGYQTHGYCHHTKFYKNLIKKLIYRVENKQKIIDSFNSCYELVDQICQEYPECIGDYKKLVPRVWHNQDMLDMPHYSSETITRSYRLLVENQEIQEPENIQIHKHEVEPVMHDLPKWKPTNNYSSQTTITMEET